MEPSPSGSFRLFRVAGVDVYLHWSWFLVAWLQISMRPDDYQMPAWKVVEYVAFFAIVLLHEFGHVLACRQVGGQAERIVLWPLGGLAYVAPPARPGAMLWSIAAGPLVNIALILPTCGLWYYAWTAGWPASHPDIFRFLFVIALFNGLNVAFNLLPIYPLDGGQILHALLWYGIGRWQSLQIVSIVGGFMGVLFFFFGMLLIVPLGVGGIFLALMAAFVTLRSYHAFHAARYMLRLEALPRHDECACPSCGISPPRGTFWVCDHCQTRFDTFRTRGHCPACGAWYLEPSCPHCRTSHHIDRWFRERPAEEVLDAIPVLLPPEHSTPS